MSILPRFYVYILCRPNGKPFYVGKGSGKRTFHHEEEARSGHKCHKCNIIRKVWKQGGEVQRYIVFTTGDEQEAFAYERELIALHGRKNLANKTDGGEGISGYVHTEAQNAKKGMMTKARYDNPEERAKTSVSVRARYTNPEERLKASEKMRAHFANPGVRARVSAAGKARYAATIEREKQRQMMLEHWSNSEERAKRTARSADPEVREKQRVAALARSTLEYRAAQSERTKQKWADPEYRLKMLAARRKQKP